MNLIKTILTLVFCFSVFSLNSYSYADACYSPDTKPLLLEEDKKPGRYFEDQPDITDEHQVHIIYSLLADSKDNEGDINGDVEKWIKNADKWILKKTKQANKSGESQTLRWDKRKDGKLDISFIRINKTSKLMKKSQYGSCDNVFARTILKHGFNDPKKIYLNFGDFKFKEWPYSVGFPLFNIFTKHGSEKLTKQDFGYFVLHESLHAMGGIYECSPNYFEGHNTKNNKSSGDLMARHVGSGKRNLDPKNDDYWDHNISDCPDMRDSVFFTPTSSTPYSPFEITCLNKEDWIISNKNLQNSIDDCYYSSGRDLKFSTMKYNGKEVKLRK